MDTKADHQTTKTDNSLEFVRLMHPILLNDSLETTRGLDNLFNLYDKMKELGSLRDMRIYMKKCRKIAIKNGVRDWREFERGSSDAELWFNPLALAVGSKSSLLITMLVRYGDVDLNGPLDNFRDTTAIEEACKNYDSSSHDKHCRIIKLLLDLGADVTGQVGVHCLENCFWGMHSNTEVMNMIIANGANVNYVDESGESLLSLALRRNNSVMRDILFENGASIESIRDIDIYKVCYTASVDNVKFILDKKSVELSTRVKALELLGACLVSNRRPMIYEALSFWTEAMQLRQSVEPSSTLTDNYRFASPSGFAHLYAPTNVEEMQALCNRPADAHLLALTIICNHYGMTCQDIKNQLLFLPSYLNYFAETRSLQPKCVIDIYLSHLKILVSFRRQNSPTDDMHFRGDRHELRRTKSPYYNTDPDWFYYLEFKENCLLYKLHVLIDAGTEIAPEVESRWTIDGLEILEALVAESEIDNGKERKAPCNYKHDLEEHAAGYDYIFQRDRESCILICTLTASVIGFLSQLHTDKTSTTYERLKTLTHRFLISQQSNSCNLMMLLNRAVLLEAHLATINIEMSSSFSNPYRTMFFSRRGADPLMRDEAGNTPLHALARLLQGRRVFEVNATRHPDDKIISAALQPIVRRYALTLLESGVHGDARDIKGKLALEKLNKQLRDKLDAFQYETLQCLAARVLRRVNYPLQELPEYLSSFVLMH